MLSAELGPGVDQAQRSPSVVELGSFAPEVNCRATTPISPMIRIEVPVIIIAHLGTGL
jgi:hypothetical protein